MYVCVLYLAFHLFAHSYTRQSFYPSGFVSECLPIELSILIYSSNYLFECLSCCLFTYAVCIHPFTKVTSRVPVDPSTQLIITIMSHLSYLFSYLIYHILSLQHYYHILS